jgi:signal transduction histidine kinase
VRRRRVSARARLTLLYTALVVAGGAVLVITTYTLVASNLHPPAATGVSDPAAYLQGCAQQAKGLQLTPTAKEKCAAVAAQAARSGAQAQRASTLEWMLIYSLSALAGVALLAAAAGWLLAGRILRPVHQLTAAARAANEHHLTGRLDLDGPRDELRELADTFDDMLARLDAAFAAQRRFISNASHELRTPLTVMRTTLDVVLAKPAAGNAELVAMGHDVRRGVQAAERLIAALLTLTRAEGGTIADDPTDLAALAEDVLDATAVPGVRLRPRLEPAPVRGDPVLLQRLVANLVDNATHYNVPGGTVAVLTAAWDGRAWLRVVNTGPVVAPELVDELFQPFTRLADRTGHEGSGLGLALVASIAAAHGAVVGAVAVPTGGLDITVSFPADRSAPLPVRPALEPSAS